ncbi:radical SAM protein [Paraburkholderia megapolitana]|uniref:radical SAM protein n=1 Tax=Paraburkholderia megapolitana TaxID=420953 RepID=UPI0038BD4A45
MTEKSGHLLNELYPDALDLILYPTEQCNFRCTYCYEDFDVGRMSVETVNAVKSFIQRKARSVSRINIKWFGGEPLAAKDIIIDVAQHALACTRDSNVHVQGDLTTNGFLLSPAVVEELVDLNQNIFQVSLDGQREIHDKTRRLLSGGNTFDRIWANLRRMAEMPINFKTILRLHLTKGNLQSIENLLKEIAEFANGDDRFFVFFKPVEQLSSRPIEDVELLARSAWATILERMHEKAAELGLGIVREDKVCYAARTNSIAIRANGKVQKCTVLLNDPVNDVGSIRSDGTLEIEAGRLIPWVEVLLGDDDRAIACPASSIMRARAGRRVIPILAN